MKGITKSDEDLESVSDILEYREVDRRRNSCFKPLIDHEANYSRDTHSYVAMVPTYPTYWSKKT